MSTGRTSTGRVLAAGSLAALAAGTLFAWSVVAGPVGDELGGDPTATGAVFALALAVFTVALLVVGPVADRASPRVVLLAAALASGAGLGVAAAAPTLAAVAVGVGVVFAAGSGTAYVAATGLAARLPAGRRSHALGVVVGGYAAGPVVLGAVGPAVVDASGWRLAVATLALVVVALGTVAAGLAPRTWPVAPSPPVAGPRRARRAGIVLLWGVFALGSAPALAVFARAVDLGTASGLDVATAGRVLSGVAAGNLAGRLLAGPLASVRGPRAGLAVALGLEAAALVVLALADGAVVTLVGVTAVGLAYGALSALVPAATAEVGDPARFGRTYGRVFTGWGLAGLVAPLVAARLTAGGDWGPLLLLGAVTAIAALAAVAALAAATRLGTRRA